MRDDREISAEQERADSDRKHGKHILGMVNHANEQPDPLLGLLEEAHQAQKEE